MIGIAKSMFCFVKLPNSVVLDVDVDLKADAQECLHKVLKHLHIIESDYFGLQYSTKDGCNNWLNLRNPIESQLGPASLAPYKLSLRVKFFVPPHRLLQAETRHQFYLNVRHALLCGELRLLQREQVIMLAAHIAQVEYGDIEVTADQYRQLLPPALALSTHTTGEEEVEELLQHIADAHRELHGTHTSLAQYATLQAAAEMPGYGTEYFNVSLESSAVAEVYGRGSHVKNEHIMAVGPDGVFIYNNKLKEKRRYEYPSIHRITSCSRSFSMMVFRDAVYKEEGEVREDCTLDVRLPSRIVAAALYRCVTEMYCFYLCETVKDNVVTQFSRDIKGMLASLFNENSTLGKKYTFDIQRTANEAYDFYRRMLYKAGEDANHQHQPASLSSSLSSSSSSSSSHGGSSGECCASLRDQLATLHDAVLCVLCVDAPLEVLFSPCKHVVCCSVCAARVDTCPVCRTSINERQTIYMPTAPPHTPAQSIYMPTAPPHTPAQSIYMPTAPPHTPAQGSSLLISSHL